MPLRLRSLPSAPILALLLLPVLLGGCLIVEGKDYRFKLNPDGSGSASITFHNIMSAEDESADASAKDYTELITRYLKGNEFEQDHPGYRNVKKRLYEEDGVLNGEVTFEFDSYEEVGLYRFENKGIWMYYTNPGGFNYEQYHSTNGTYGGDSMPVIFWSEGTKEFTVITKFESTERKTRSLLPLYRRLGTN